MSGSPGEQIAAGEADDEEQVVLRGDVEVALPAPHDDCWHSLEECNPDASNGRASYICWITEALLRRTASVTFHAAENPSEP